MTTIQQECLEGIRMIYNDKRVHELLDDLSKRLFHLIELYAYFYKKNLRDLIYVLFCEQSDWHGVGKFYKTIDNPTVEDRNKFYKLIYNKMNKPTHEGGGNLREKMYCIFMLNVNVCYNNKCLEGANDIPDLLWWLMEMVYMYENITKSNIPREKYMPFYRELFRVIQIDKTNILDRMKVIVNELGTQSFSDVLDLIYTRESDGIFVKVKNPKPYASAFCYLMRPTVSLLYSLRDALSPSRRVKKPIKTSNDIPHYSTIRYPKLSNEERNYLDSVGATHWTLASEETMANPDHVFTIMAKKYGKDVISGISGTSITMLDFFKIFIDVNKNTENRPLLVALMFYFLCSPYPADHSPHEVFTSAEILSVVEHEKYHWIDYDVNDTIPQTVKKLLNTIHTHKHKLNTNNKHTRYDDGFFMIENYV